MEASPRIVSKIARAVRKDVSYQIVETRRLQAGAIENAVLEGFRDGRTALRRSGMTKAVDRATDALLHVAADVQKAYWHGWICGARLDGKYLRTANTVQQGRPGSNNYFAKLTDEQVLEIRSRSSEKQARLAREYQVDKNTIRRIRRRETWSHLQ